MVKQCSSKQHSTLFASATDDELFVSQILLELENLFMVSEFPTEFIWGRKKRRSSLVEASSYSPEQPTSQPASIQSIDKEVKVRTPQVKAEECPAAKTYSPTTPLSFFPSESDEKSKHSSKKRASVFLYSLSLFLWVWQLGLIFKFFIFSVFVGYVYLLKTTLLFVDIAYLVR